MQDYVHHDGCLMEFLARELDDDHPRLCGRCQNCDPTHRLPESYEHATGLAAAEFMQNVVVEIPPKKKAGSLEEVKVRFPEYQFSNYFAELEHEPGRALS
jgi:ATP-dependent DNA helicase RecQ